MKPIIKYFGLYWQAAGQVQKIFTCNSQNSIDFPFTKRNLSSRITICVFEEFCVFVDQINNPFDRNSSFLSEQIDDRFEFLFFGRVSS